jgi:chemotaxis signal transduction protein
VTRATAVPSEKLSQLTARMARLLERSDATADAAQDAGARIAILAARARILAAPRMALDQSPKDRLDILIFSIGTARLAMPLGSVIGIVRTAIVTPLPRAVAPVYGVTAWRGRPLTVLSLGGALAGNETERRVLVLGDARRAVAGLMVDSADETRVVARSELSALPAGPRGTPALGMTTDAVLVIDADALLNAARNEL